MIVNSTVRPIYWYTLVIGYWGLYEIWERLKPRLRGSLEGREEIYLCMIFMRVDN